MTARPFVDVEPDEIDDPVAIGSAIARRFDLGFGEMIGRCRAVPYAAARAELYATLREQGWSLAKIGRLVGRDHSTVRAGLLARAAGKYVNPKPSPRRKK